MKRPRTQRSPALVTPGLQNCGDAVQAISEGRFIQPHGASQDRPLTDKHGHRHSEHVLKNWSPRMLEIMGVRRDGGAP
jgi:hypothetical protein